MHPATYIIEAQIWDGQEGGIAARRMISGPIESARSYAQQMAKAHAGKLGHQGSIAIYRALETDPRINGHREEIERIPAY